MPVADRLDVAWALLMEWEPELLVVTADNGRQLLLHQDRRQRAYELRDRIAEPPGPLAATWGGPDPGHAPPGSITVPASARRRPPPT